MQGGVLILMLCKLLKGATITYQEIVTIFLRSITILSLLLFKVFEIRGLHLH